MPSHTEQERAKRLLARPIDSFKRFARSAEATRRVNLNRARPDFNKGRVIKPPKKPTPPVQPPGDSATVTKVKLDNTVGGIAKKLRDKKRLLDSIK